MAIAEDASSPATVTAAASSSALTTASFSPPAGSLLIALASFGPLSGTCTLSVSDSGSHTWTLGKRQNATGVPTSEVWWTYLASAPGSITVTATPTNGGAGQLLTVRVLTGCSPTQTGATGSTSGVTPTVSVTTTQAGSWVYGVLGDNATAQAQLTANANTSVISWFQDTSEVETYSSFKGAASTSSPGATTFGFTTGNSDTYEIAAMEVLPAAAIFPQPVIVRQAVRRAATY
jgi:hypothetical protein